MKFYEKLALFYLAKNGQMVLRGIGRLDIGLAAIGGLGIVLLAIILDRLTQEMGKNDKNDKRRWYEKGPIAFILNLRRKNVK